MSNRPRVRGRLNPTAAQRHDINHAASTQLLELQCALPYLFAVDTERQDYIAARAKVITESVMARRAVHDLTKRVLFARILSALIVDNWTECDTGTVTDAALTRELESIERGMSRELDRLLVKADVA